MKKHLLILLTTLAIPLSGFAATVIHIDDPDNWSASSLNQYKGQTVTFDVPIYIVNNYYSNFSCSPKRIYSFTHDNYPSESGYAAWKSNGEKSVFTLNGLSAGTPRHRMGEQLLNLTVKVNSASSVDYVSGTWKGTNTRAELEQGYDSATIDRNGKHTILVCAMNCEYYMTEAFGTGSSSSMGPKDNAEHQKQRAKVGAALAKIKADLYGLVEIQKGQGAMNELAADLCTKTGKKYRYVADNSAVSGTYVKTGYIYNSDILEPVQRSATEMGTDGRKRIMGFREKKTGETFIYSINHFKAKSGTGSGLDADKKDGQAQFNNSRKAESQKVMAAYESMRSQMDDDDILIMGDLNAYALEDPITEFTTAGFKDLHREFHGVNSYSYTFHGQAGYLDHAIASPSMYKQVTGMMAYHINSDENDNYTYNGSWADETMFRCSDHDPVLVGIRLDSTLYKASNDVLAAASQVDGETYITVMGATDNGTSKAWCRLTTIDGRVIYHSYTEVKEISEEESITLYKEEEMISIPTSNFSFLTTVPPGLYILTVYTSDRKITSKKILIP